MKERKGEKWGWAGGWMGGFTWLLLLSIIWLVKGKILVGLIGFCLFTLAIIFIFAFAPWKHPETKYWKLLLPVYLVLILSASLFILFEGGLKAVGLNWWSLFYLTPCFIPFATMGSRRWKDGDA